MDTDQTIALCWTPKTKRRLHTWRKSTNKPKKPKKIVGTMSRADFRTLLRDERRWIAKTIYTRWILDEPPLTPAHIAVAEGIQESWSGEHDDAKLDLEEESLIACVWNMRFSRPDKHNNLGKLWVQTEGPVFALRAFFSARRHAPHLSSEPTNLEKDELETLKQIRKALSTISEEDYQHAKAAALEFWQETELELSARCALAYLFPEERTWGDEAAHIAFGKPYHYGHTIELLFASGASVKNLKALAEQYAQHSLLAMARTYYISMVDIQGAAILPWLLDKYRDLQTHDHDEDTILPLALFLDASVAEVFVAKLEHWSRDTPDLEIGWLKKHPQLALPALRAHPNLGSIGTDVLKAITATGIHP